MVGDSVPEESVLPVNFFLSPTKEVPHLFLSFSTFFFFKVSSVFVFVFLHQWGLSCSPSLTNFLPLFWPDPRGENPSMPKIYAKHNSIPCGFMTAKKPGGKSRGQIP